MFGNVIKKVKGNIMIDQALSCKKYKNGYTSLFSYLEWSRITDEEAKFSFNGNTEFMNTVLLSMAYEKFPSHRKWTIDGVEDK